MVKTTSKKISVKASAANPLENSTPGDKTLWLDPVILSYTSEDGDETAEG